MSWWHRLWRGRQFEEQLDRELRFHLDQHEADLIAQGYAPEEARRMARLAIGGPEQVKEECRDERVIPWLESSLQDLRHGLVLMRRDAGVSALIAVVLALGMGGSAAVFTLLEAAFLRPLPFRDAGRLVSIIENDGWDPSVSEFQEIRSRSRAFEHLALSEYIDLQLTGAGEPTCVFAARISASFFPLLGVNAALGRTFLEEDNQPGRAPAVLLTDSFWRSRMGSDPKVIGRTLELDGEAAVIVGVLPSGFHFDYPTLGADAPVELYVSYPLEPSLPFARSANGQGSPVHVMGRLRKGVTLAQARADLWDTALALARKYTSPFPGHPHDPVMFGFTVMPLRDAIVASQRSLLWLLISAAGVLLLIACVNTAQLLLARSLRRAREIAVRAALGASRRRLIRQFLLEGLVLAGCGGAVGLLMAGWLARLLVALLPERSPLLASAHVDVLACGFALAIVVISAVGFAIIPAVRSTRWAPGPTLSARMTVGEGNRWRHAMLAIEAALSVFLLCGAGLVTQNLWKLISTPMGFDPRHVLTMELKLPFGLPTQPDPRAGPALQRDLEKIEAIPGVEAAATVTGLPLRPWRGGGPVKLAGMSDPGTLVMSYQISPDYFRALAIPLLDGRTFRPTDAGPNINVAIVNEEFARHFGLGPDVIGKQIDDPTMPATIVGMVGNVRALGLETEPWPQFYMSYLQISWPHVYLAVRSQLPAGQLLKQVRAAIASSDPGQAVFAVQTMDDFITDSVAEPRFDVYLIGAFALLAAAMAAAGMYSVISFLVSQRTSEMAIRMALGASRGTILRTVLGTTSFFVAAGLAGGLGLGWAASKTLRSLTNAEAGGSPGMYAAVVLFFLALALLATYLPARRASRLDPAAALRWE